MTDDAARVDPSWLAAHVRDIPDYPQPGVVFKDITPLLADAAAFAFMVDHLAGPVEAARVDKVLGTEARGFVLAGALARRLDAGFVPVRKAGKLPWEVERLEYALEYGTDSLEIHRDAIRPGERVVICDDVLATGGTAAATVALAERLGAEVVSLAFLIELAFLGGRSRLEEHQVHTLLSYS
ncbi:MAG: adenine phosphoribosyltransferase [Acidimicrobiia bacterium]